MAAYVLSVVVSGPGTDPNHRSHWAFAIHQADSEFGDILDVNVIDLKGLIYQFGIQRCVRLHGPSSEGSFVVTYLTREQAREVEMIIKKEPAPRNGIDRCQDWVLNVLICLEAEELVKPGTAEWISSLVGKPAAVVAQSVGQRWTSTSDACPALA